jgi:demethylmenaquinone methyltransferase / 2-methoxy-6-polyprenyl-1,4-benzoquinol methylase
MDRPHGVVPAGPQREIGTVREAETNGQTIACGHAPHPVLRPWYDEAGQRAGFVRALFDAGAGGYDRINRLLSFNTGGRYRAHMLRRAGLQPGDTVLDVATGTGLVAREARRLVEPGGVVVGLDVSAGMLAVARRQSGLALLQADAERLPVADGGFDMVTMGYALRHVGDFGRAFAEFRRVLRPGGTLVLMEIARPRSRAGYALARLYLGHAVPLVSRALGGGRQAGRMMRYYWDTIEHCASEASILAALRGQGFERTRCETELGLFKTYVARNPLAPAAE